MKPCVTVIVPAYNVHPYFWDMFNSLYKQKEVRRIILVDDCSTDSTYLDLSRAARLNHGGCPYIEAYRLQDHHNQYFAKNVALHQLSNSTQTPYIAFMDADDISYPDRLTRQIEIMENNKDVWAVGGACHNINEDGSTDSPDNCVAWPLEQDPLLKGQRSYGIGLWNATACYRKEVFDWLGSFDYTPGMGDTEWFIRLVWSTVLANKQIRNLQSPVIHRRLRDNQVSETSSKTTNPWRVAYEAFLKQKFIFLKTIHKLGMLSKHHVYRANQVRSSHYKEVHFTHLDG